MASADLPTEKKHNGLPNGLSLGEEVSPAARPKGAAKAGAPKKSRNETAVPSVRYFLSGDAASVTPQLAEERPSEVDAIAEAFRNRVSFFVVQEFTVEVQNHQGAPLLRKHPVKDRSSP